MGYNGSNVPKMALIYYLIFTFISTIIIITVLGIAISSNIELKTNHYTITQNGKEYTGSHIETYLFSDSLMLKSDDSAILFDPKNGPISIMKEKK